MSEDGKPVKTVDDWNDIRRPELMALFRGHMYGIRPGTPHEVKFNEVARREDVCGSSATAKQVRATITAKKGSHSFDFVLVTPKSVHPVPLVVMINNRSSISFEKTISETHEFWPVEKFIRRGYATACFVTSDVDPDDRNGYDKEICALLDDPASDPETRWRCISSWGWAASRVLDYCLEQPGIDPERTAIVGHSRGGKTAFWAGAEETRFKLVYANNSGSAGAKLTRRIFGGTIGFTTKVFPHWLCAKSANYGGNESKMPVDQHLLIALIAPRAVYVASADRDLWADPKGEYISLVGAAPVYGLCGVKLITNPDMPALDQPRHVGKTGYHVREGNHNLGDVDWNHFLDFAGGVFKR